MKKSPFDSKENKLKSYKPVSKEMRINKCIKSFDQFAVPISLKFQNEE